MADGIGSLKVADPHKPRARFFDEDGERTDGSVSCHVIRDLAGVLEYLQSDGSSWSSSIHDFGSTYVDGWWRGDAPAIPASAQDGSGKQISYVLTHSDTDLPEPYVENFRILAHDEDDSPIFVRLSP